MSHRSRIALGLAGAVALSAVLAAPAAAKPTLQCGQTITVSTKLKHDLTGCTGSGLVVGADGITIDLGGHSIKGVNAPGSVGIDSDGHPGVTIENGSIADFFVDGVRLHASPRSVVRNLTVLRIGAGNVEGDAAAGVLVDSSARTRVIDNTLSNDVVSFQSDGVDVLNSPRTVLKNNRLVRNSWNGAVVIGSADSKVVGNTLNLNGNQGVEVNAGSDRIVVAGNRARGNTQSGLVVGAVKDAHVFGNRLSGNHEAGIFMFDLIDSTIAANIATGNGVGIQLFGGQFGSHGNQIRGNRAERNGDVGILLEEGADHNRVSGNTANGNKGLDGAGILLFNAAGNTIDHNTANRNAFDGIAIFEDPAGVSAGNRIVKNTTNRNGGHGIEAAAGGTVDGGGNKSRHNGTPPECIGVVCA